MHGSSIPLQVNLMPSGKYLMEDFYYAGGLPVVLKQLIGAGIVNPNVLTVNGKPIGDNVADVECYNTNVIYPYDKPLQPKAGIAVLKVCQLFVWFSMTQCSHIVTLCLVAG